MKKNKLLIVTFLFILAFSFFVPNLFSKNVSYADDLVYTEIDSIQDFFQIGDSLPLNGNYILTSDLNFEISEGIFANFKPIGIRLNAEGTTVNAVEPFTGVFNGNGYKIKNLYIGNKIYPYFHASLFAKTLNATIKNLALENVYLDRLGVIPELSSSSSTLFAAGLVSEAENTLIENSYVEFNSSSKVGDLVLTETTKTTTSLYFGGLVAKAIAGTHIQNSYADVSAEFNIFGDQAAEIKIGGVVGSLENSKINNVYSKGVLKSYVTSSDEISSITSTNSGSIAGFVLGQLSQINGVYADMTIYSENTTVSAETAVGGFVGKISSSPASTPSQGNLTYVIVNSKTLSNGQPVALTNFFGIVSGYNASTSQLTNLTQNNYGIFTNPSVWSPYENYSWNTDDIWTINSEKLPTLQKFSSYTVQLLPQNTSVELGQSSQTNAVVDLSFVSGSGQIKHGEQVEILISIINGYDIYYYLTSVQIDNLKSQTQINVYLNQANEDFTLIEVDPEVTTLNLTGVTSTKLYLLSYEISDNTSGGVSVTLNKQPYELTVETANSNMGKVRKKDSNLYQESFTHDITNANTYDFFAVPNNNDYAFSKWVIQRASEEEQEPEIIELDLSYSSFHQITFAFGINGKQDITQEILNGGKLIAVFTSNVSKITLNLQLTQSTDASGAGYITFTLGGPQAPLNEIISREKEVALTLIAVANDGFVFVGWYDADNRLLSDQSTYNFVPSEDETQIFARYTNGERASDLLWLWITLGTLLAAGAGVGIFFIIKARTGDMSYRNFY